MFHLIHRPVAFLVSLVRASSLWQTATFFKRRAAREPPLHLRDYTHTAQRVRARGCDERQVKADIIQSSMLGLELSGTQGNKLASFGSLDDGDGLGLRRSKWKRRQGRRAMPLT